VTKKLAFGVELLELSYDKVNQRFNLDTISQPVGSLKKEKEEKEVTQKVHIPYVKQSKDEDVFIDVS